MFTKLIDSILETIDNLLPVLSKWLDKFERQWRWIILNEIPPAPPVGSSWEKPDPFPIHPPAGDTAYERVETVVEIFMGEIITDENRVEIEDAMITYYGYNPDKKCTMCNDRPEFYKNILTSMCAVHLQMYVDKGWR